MATLEKRSDVTIMLLGPGNQFLAYRRSVRDELELMGYKVIIMEEVKGKASDGGIDGKFERIVSCDDPTIFVAIFHKGAAMDAVIFEIGCINCHYGTHDIGKKLRFLYDKGYDLKNATAYIGTLLPKIPCVEIDESKSYAKASEIIHNFVVNL